MKKILVLLLLALSACGLFTAFFLVTNQQTTIVQEAAAKVGAAFSVPSDPALADPDKTFAAMERSATIAGVNIFRTSVGYSSTDRLQVSEYVLQTTTYTRFYDDLHINGRRLTVDESKGTDAFLSTQQSVSAHQVGTIQWLGDNSITTVRPLRAVAQTLSVAGVYYYETQSPADGHRFLTELSRELTAAGGVPITAADLSAASGIAVDEGPEYAPLSIGIAVALIALVAVLTAYRQLREGKRTAVYRLHGYSLAASWFAISGRLLAIIAAAAGLSAALIAALLPGSSTTFVLTTLRWQGFILIAVVGASLIASLYLVPLRLSDLIKNRRDTGPLFAFNTFFKAVCTVLVLIVGAGVWAQYQNDRSGIAGLGDWQAADGYGIFYPTSVGNDLTAFQSSGEQPMVAESRSLYPALNRQGALYIDASTYEPQALAEPTPSGVYRSVQVNVNYLHQFPIHDTNGQPVDIPDTDRDWVVLVPAKYKDQASALQSYFQTSRTGDGQQQGIAEQERSNSHLDVPAWMDHQRVTVVWIADQAVFGFDPSINPTGHGAIDSPIIQVSTAANSLPLDFANAVTGNGGAAMKVKLVDKDPTKTLDALRPELTTLHLDDNLRYLVTLDEYAQQQLAFYRSDMKTVLGVGTLLLVALLMLIAQSMSMSFDRFSRRVAVRRMLGTPFIASHREFLRFFTIVWIAQVIVALAANAAGANPLASGSSAPLANVLFVSIAVALLELGVSAVVLARIERRRIIDTLKGEF